MITPEFLLWTLPIAVVGTATLSGVFGMGGGLILMGLFAQVLPVPEAMVLHGTIQLASNGFRALFLLSHVRWRICGFYLIGGVVGWAVCRALGVVIDRTTLFLVLGGFPLLAALIRTPPGFSATFPPAAVLCGLVVTGAQVVAGVSGPLLDVFFVKSDLTPREVIGTKALTQCVGHSLKLVYFLPLLRELPEPPVVGTPAIVLALGCAALGTWIGRSLLARLSTERFRRFSTWLAVVLAIVFLSRGLAGLFAA